ncbi:MAG: class I SAM-dependent methyltransferase [Cellulosilyticaceae bacterium]
MEIYNDFAKVYDTFMGDTPYEKWAEFMHSQIEQYGVTPKIMCDLGCGTGKMCEIFADQGIDMIGIDISEEMLMVARENAMEQGKSILYLLQDMSEFELYGTVDVIYSCCDSINYLVEQEDVLKVFELVSNYLEENGLFIFDINTPYKYQEVLGNQVFAEQSEDAAYIWENYYDEEEAINEFNVNFFIKDENGRYERTEEVHYQKAYSVETIKQLLNSAGLELLAVYDDYTNKPYGDTTIRATFIAREIRHQGKYYENK